MTIVATRCNEKRLASLSIFAGSHRENDSVDRSMIRAGICVTAAMIVLAIIRRWAVVFTIPTSSTGKFVPTIFIDIHIHTYTLYITYYISTARCVSRKMPHVTYPSLSHSHSHSFSLANILPISINFSLFVCSVYGKRETRT